MNLPSALLPKITTEEEFQAALNKAAVILNTTDPLPDENQPNPPQTTAAPSITNSNTPPEEDQPNPPQTTAAPHITNSNPPPEEGQPNPTQTTVAPPIANTTPPPFTTAAVEELTEAEPGASACDSTAIEGSGPTATAAISGCALRVGDVLFYRSHVFVSGDKRGERVSAVAKITSEPDHPLLMENGEVLPSTQQVKLVKQFVDGKLVDCHDQQFWEVGEYDLISAPASDEDHNRQSEYALALEESVSAFRKKFQQLAENTGMPIDLLHRKSSENQHHNLQENSPSHEAEAQRTSVLHDEPSEEATPEVEVEEVNKGNGEEGSVEVQNEEAGQSIDSSDEESEKASKESKERGNACCCGCGLDATLSNHYCSVTDKRVMSWCYSTNPEMEEGFGSRGICNGCDQKQKPGSLGYRLPRCCYGCNLVSEDSQLRCLHTGKRVLLGHGCPGEHIDIKKTTTFLCRGCHAKLAPPEGTPGRSALRQQSKDAMVAQGERMRKYAQRRSNGNKSGPLEVGTVVRVKVDKVDRGKLDHRSVPGVIVEVTEHDNYRIVCKGGLLRDCLGAQRFQVEALKQAEHYDLTEAVANWKHFRHISIREALTCISKMGGQGFFFCNCKGKCDKNNCKCRKNHRPCNSKCHPTSTCCVNQS